jgi:hypothetical protein
MFPKQQLSSRVVRLSNYHYTPGSGLIPTLLADVCSFAAAFRSQANYATGSAKT